MGEGRFYVAVEFLDVGHFAGRHREELLLVVVAAYCAVELVLVLSHWTSSI